MAERQPPSLAWRALTSGVALAALCLVALCAVRTARRATACHMSFSRPHFVEHHAPVASRVRRYRLWRYLHAGVAPPPSGRGRRRVLPVVFVPGHAGSHTQARSLCSALAERDDAASPAVDCWALDFLGEPTALLGHAMWRQSEFVNDAVSTLRATYGAPAPAVAIVGHSLGGTVGRGALSVPNHVHGSIGTVLTLGSPHTAAPVWLDAECARYFQVVNRDLVRASEVAQQLEGAAPCRAAEGVSGEGGGVCSTAAAAAAPADTAARDEELQRVALLSLSSGLDDTQVWERLTVVTDMLPPLAARGGNGSAAGRLHRLPVAWLSSARLPRGGVTISHERTVWCQQLVQPLAKALVQLARGGAAQRGATAAGAHARLRTLLAGLAGEAAGEEDGGDAWATSPMGGSSSAPAHGAAWWRLVAWLFLAPAERAHWPLAGGEAAALTGEAWVAGTVVRYGPTLAIAAVVVVMLAVSATAASAAARLLGASGAAAAAASPPARAPSASGADVDGGVFDPAPLFRASALPARFASRAVWRCGQHARRTQRAAAAWGLAAVALAGAATVALWPAGPSVVSLVLVSGAAQLWSTVASPQVPVGVTALCLVLALGALDAAARVTSALRHRLSCARAPPAVAAAATPVDAAACRRRVLLLHALLAALLVPTWFGSLDRLTRAALGRDVSFVLPREARTLAGDAAWVAAAALALLQLAWRGGCGLRRGLSEPPAPLPAAPHGGLRALLVDTVCSGSHLAAAAGVPPVRRSAPSPVSAVALPADAAAASTQHGECCECFHEDGGRHALLVDTLGSAPPPRTERVVVVAPGVWLGPVWRVVACDCWADAQPSATPVDAAALRAALCAFCSCQCAACGGSPQAARLRAASGGAGAVSARGHGTRAPSVLWAVLSPAQWLWGGTGHALHDACVIAVAYATGALAVALCCAGDAAHARDVVVAVAAACSGCCVSLLRAQRDAARVRAGPRAHAR